MGFLIKFLKELNSTENEKFISLAIVLGLIAGFLPFFNIFTLIILFLAFIIRIPFGLFLASWGVFSIIGYFLDPIFAKTGYYLLTSSLLTPIWEFIYNIPLMRWSGYNNTVVMGGFIWGVVLSIVLYFILNKTIKIYREKVFGFFRKYKILSWIVPQENKKSKIFRLSGIIGFGVIVGGFVLVISLFLDPLLKFGLEFSLSKTLHKNVKIGSLTTSLTDAKIDIKDIYIGDIKTDKVLVKFSWKYLLWRKFDIEKLIISNIHTQKSIFNLTSSNKKTSSNSNIKIKENFKFLIPKPEKILANYKLESLQKIEKLKSDYEKFLKISKNIKNSLKNEKEKIEKIKQEIKNLEKTSKNIKSLDDIQKILANVNSIKKEINSLKDDLKTKKEEIVSLKKEIMNDIKEVKIAAKNDYENIAKRYDMLKNKEYMKFAESFIKPEINYYINKVVEFYNFVKPYIYSNNEKEEYIRLKGIYIKYKDKIIYPDFVLEFAKIDGKSRDVSIKGILKNISDNQRLLNKYGEIKLLATSKYFKRANLDVKYLEKILFNLNAKEIYINRFDLGNIKILNSIANLKSNGEIYNSDLNIKSYFVIYPKKIIFNGNKYIKNALNSIREINFDIKIVGNVKNYKVKVNSNLDKIISKYLQKKIKSEINKAKIRLKKLINKKISVEMKKIGIKNSNFDVINEINRLQNSTNSLNDLLKKYTKKELSKKLLKKGIGNFIKF